MFDKLSAIEERYENLMALVSDAAVQADPAEYRTYSKALADIQPLVETFREHRSALTEIAQVQELADSSEGDMRDLAHQELRTLEARRDTLLTAIKTLLVPKDPNDEKNVVLEIRAGTGARKPRCSRQISSGCTTSSRSGKAGAWKCFPPTKQAWVD